MGLWVWSFETTFVSQTQLSCCSGYQLRVIILRISGLCHAHSSMKQLISCIYMDRWSAVFWELACGLWKANSWQFLGAYEHTQIWPWAEEQAFYSTPCAALLICCWWHLDPLSNGTLGHETTDIDYQDSTHISVSFQDILIYPVWYFAVLKITFPVAISNPTY